MDDTLIQLHSLNTAVKALEQCTVREVGDANPGLTQDDLAQVLTYLRDQMLQTFSRQRLLLLERLVFAEDYLIVKPGEAPLSIAREEPAPDLDVLEVQDPPAEKQRRKPGPKPKLKPENPIEQARKWCIQERWHQVLDLYERSVEEERAELEQLLSEHGKRPIWSDAAHKYIVTSIIPEMEYVSCISKLEI